MKKASLLDDYLHKYASSERWRLITQNKKAVSSVVVIPAYAEKESLFFTLASLAQNPAYSLDDTLVICVVNNRISSPQEDIENNRETMQIMEALTGGKSLDEYRADRDLYGQLEAVVDQRINLGYIDASSSRLALSDETGGVGMARKIGMDAALRMWKHDLSANKLIFSLDADTLVKSNYLSSVRNNFKKQIKTTITAYAHHIPHRQEAQAAICCYEIFLRYWALGLRYARSPYAYHSIGSTIITTAEAYLEVRGMNRRRAGEDFYFLNKLAKVGEINYLRDTRVYPSARPSLRVPFGTGKTIHGFVSGLSREYLLYDPRVFIVVERWLKLMGEAGEGGIEEIIERAGRIHPALKSFLKIHCFEDVWPQIRSNVKNKKILARHFHFWFDAFKTLKLINYLTREAYPRIEMRPAIREMMNLSGQADCPFSSAEGDISFAEQIFLLLYLREIT